MAANIFIKVGDVKGESQDDEHQEWIDVLSWSWGLSQPGSFGSGGGGGTGKVNVHDLSFTKYVDAASPDLVKTCANGKHHETAELHVVKAGEKALPYLKYKFTKVLISSVQTGGSGAEDRLTENVSLNFNEFAMDYTKQSDTGAGDTTASMGWNIGKGVEV